MLPKNIVCTSTFSLVFFFSRLDAHISKSLFPYSIVSKMPKHSDIQSSKAVSSSGEPSDSVDIDKEVVDKGRWCVHLCWIHPQRQVDGL